MKDKGIKKVRIEYEDGSYIQLTDPVACAQWDDMARSQAGMAYVHGMQYSPLPWEIGKLPVPGRAELAVLPRIRDALGEVELLDAVLDVLHDIGGNYFCRRKVEEHKTKPMTMVLWESMKKKVISDEEIESLTLDVWEAVVLRLHELKKGKKDG